MAVEINLRGKKGLILGIADEHSIAYGCAEIFTRAGAEIALTYQNERLRPTAAGIGTSLHVAHTYPCDVRDDLQLLTLFDLIKRDIGSLDFVLHSIAYAPKADLHGRVVDCSREGFLHAMEISCYSFMRIAKLAEPLMHEGSSLLTVSYMGSKEVVPHYGIMGPVKAALESVTRYMAAELGPKGIRVNALSPGPIMTRAASGIECFDQLLSSTRNKAPMHRNIDLNDIGYMAAFLASDLSKNITGGVHYIDAGYEAVD